MLKLNFKKIKFFVLIFYMYNYNLLDLFKKFLPIVQITVEKFKNTIEEIDDLEQILLLKLFKILSKYISDNAPFSLEDLQKLIFKSLKNAAIDFYRKEKRRKDNIFIDNEIFNYNLNEETPEKLCISKLTFKYIVAELKNINFSFEEKAIISKMIEIVETENRKVSIDEIKKILKIPKHKFLILKKSIIKKVKKKLNNFWNEFKGY